MSYPSDPSPLPNAVRRVAFSLRTAGWVCFWTQLVLGVIAAIIQIFAIAVFSRESAGATTAGTTPGIEGGLILSLLGLGVLGFSIFQAFRYTRLARQLKAPGMSRPSRGKTLKQIRIGLISNMTGMLLTLLAAEAINGLLLAKAISQPRGLLSASVNLQDFIQPLDFFVVLANTHSTVAHFTGIAAALWLMNEIYKEN